MNTNLTVLPYSRDQPKLELKLENEKIKCFKNFSAEFASFFRSKR